MASRRRSRPTMTLFAFQDVIMSVSGIIIVILLLLTLELIQQPGQQAAAANLDLSGDFQHAIDEAARDIAQIESELTKADRLIRESTHESPDELRRRIGQGRDEIERLQQENQRLAGQLEALRDAEKQAKLRQFENGDDQERLDALQAEVAVTAEQIEQERIEDRPLYSAPRGFSGSGWVAVVSANRVALAPLGVAAKPTVFTTSGRFLRDDASRQFLNWVDSNADSSAYFLLLIRPDGVESFERIQQGLDERAVSYGFDVVGANQVVLHPERGAVE